MNSKKCSATNDENLLRESIFGLWESLNWLRRCATNSKSKQNHKLKFTIFSSSLSIEAKM